MTGSDDKLVVQPKPSNALAVARTQADTISVTIRLGRPAHQTLSNLARLALYLLAVATAIHGCVIMRGIAFRREVLLEREAGAPFFLLAVALWLLAELMGNWSSLKTWWRDLDQLRRQRWLARVLPLVLAVSALPPLYEVVRVPLELAPDFVRQGGTRLALAALAWIVIEAFFIWQWRKGSDLRSPSSASGDAQPPRQIEAAPPLPRGADWSWRQVSPTRWARIALAALASGYVWVNSANNIFLPPTIVVWLLSALLWMLALAPPGWRLRALLLDTFARDLSIPLRRYWWAYLGFAGVMLLGISFRLTDLAGVPREINHDAYLEIADAYDFVQGTETPVYFMYNNGRPFMLVYIAVALASLPGLGFEFYTMKLASALPSVLALPFMFWLGYEIIGSKRRNLAIVFGLLLAGFAGASTWEVAVVRTGLTAALSSPFSAILALFLIRGIRNNRRWDFIFAGVALGFSLHSYQTARIFPVAVFAVVLLALALKRMTRRERLNMVANLLVLVCVSFMIFLPLFRFMLDWPQSFWFRANMVVSLERYLDSTGLTAAEFYAVQLVESFWRYLLMFHSEGDTEWIYNVPGVPTFNVMTGALLLLGSLSWVIRALKSRDPVIWALPILLIVMYIPAIVSASPLTHAPAQQRPLIAMPVVYVFVVFALVVIGRQVLRSFIGPLAIGLCTFLFVGTILISNHLNSSFYFDDYHDYHLYRTPPLADGGTLLRGFIDSDGTIGNSFIVVDGLGETRYIAAMADIVYFQNSVWAMHELPIVLYDAYYRAVDQMDPDRDLFFLYAPSFPEALPELERQFPTGYAVEIPSSRPGANYGVYRVPAPGEAAIIDFLERHGYN